MRYSLLLRAVLFGCGFSGTWALSDEYYMKMRRQGRWILHGEGTLWDSAWALRHIRAVEASSPSAWIWAVSKALREEKAFQSLHFTYTGRGDGRIVARTQEPVARVSLPLRQYYISADQQRLPFIKPLDLPIIEAPRWDSTAFGLILDFWQKNPTYYKATSRMYQGSDGIWRIYLEICSETFLLGRTEHLPIGFAQMPVYLRSLQPQIGGFTCKTVLLYIPDQIICQ